MALAFVIKLFLIKQNIIILFFILLCYNVLLLTGFIMNISESGPFSCSQYASCCLSGFGIPVGKAVRTLKNILKITEPYQPAIAAFVILGKVLWKHSQSSKLRAEIARLDKKVILVKNLINCDSGLFCKDRELGKIQNRNSDYYWIRNKMHYG